MLRKFLASLLVLFLVVQGSLAAEFGPRRTLLSGNQVPSWVQAKFGPLVPYLDWADDWQQGLTWIKGKGTFSSNTVYTDASTSVRYVSDLSGNWTAIQPGFLPRSNSGLWPWETRTNSIRNNSAQGSGAGSPGTLPTNWTLSNPTGLTRTISPLTINGIDGVSINWTGTTTSTISISILPEAINQIAAASGQAWASSYFAQVLQDDPALTVINVTTQGTNGASATETSLTNWYATRSVFNRYSNVFTLANAGTTNVRTTLGTNSIASGTTINLTIWIGWPQTELGAFATSPIRTTGTAVQRNGSVITMNADYVPIFGSGVSEAIRFVPQGPITQASNQTLYSIDDGTTSNRISLARATASGNAITLNSIGGANTAVSWANGASGKLAQAFASGSQATDFNGGTVATASNLGFPSALTNIHVGVAASGAGFANGQLILSAVAALQRIPNSVLQTWAGQ